MRPLRPLPPSMEGDLAAWGRVITLETTGRRSGRPRSVTIGFVEGSDGSLLVAAASERTQWARNLLAQADCHVRRPGTRQRYRAVPLEGDERRSAIVRLILKYGAPAERLGGGPAFCLQPVDAAPLPDTPDG